MTMRRLGLAAAAATTSLLLLAGCGGGSDDEDVAEQASDEEAAAPAGGGDAVAIEGFKFSPGELTVAAGTELTVTNGDDAAHTLTAEDGSFDTGELAGGEEGAITLDEPGEHPYFCEIHQYMRGSITVE